MSEENKEPTQIDIEEAIEEEQRKKAVKYARRVRHWRQQLEPYGAYVFRKPVTWAGKRYAPGEQVPESLTSNTRKMKSFWNAEYIIRRAYQSARQN